MDSTNTNRGRKVRHLSVMDYDDIYACSEEELLELCEAHGVKVRIEADGTTFDTFAACEELDTIRNEMIAEKRERQSEGER